MTTILDIVQNAAGVAGVSYQITSVVGNDDATVTQLKALLNMEGKELRRQFWWTELSRSHLFATVDTKSIYDLPVDFDAQVYSTFWDRTDHWRLRGPITMDEAQREQSAITTTTIRRKFRIRGGKIEIIDAPEDDDLIYVFDYQSKSWLAPTTTWSSGSSISSGDKLKNDRTGAVYEATSTGTSGGTTSITVGTTSNRYDISDLTLSFELYNGSANTIYYELGDYTVTADTDSESLAAGKTAYLTRDYTETHIAMIAGASSSGVTIKGEPVHTGNGEELRDGYSDGVKWKLVTYEEVTADTDVVLLDGELLSLGLLWRFLRAQNMEYQHYLADYKKQVRLRLAALRGARPVQAGRKSGRRFMSSCNLPDTGYGGV